MIEIGETTLVFSESEAGEQQPAADFAPTVVDARKSLEQFRDSRQFPVPDEDDTARGGELESDGRGERRSQKNLRILRNFAELA